MELKEMVDGAMAKAAAEGKGYVPTDRRMVAETWAAMQQIVAAVGQLTGPGGDMKMPGIVRMMMGGRGKKAPFEADWSDPNSVAAGLSSIYGEPVVVLVGEPAMEAVAVLNANGNGQVPDAN